MLQCEPAVYLGHDLACFARVTNATLAPQSVSF